MTQSSASSPSRRQFLGQSILAAAAVTQACRSSVSEQARATEPRTDAAVPPAEVWAAVRADFELSDDVVHMAQMLLASHPTPVREAIERHRAGLDANTAQYVYANWATNAEALADDGEQRAANAAARYLETDARLIALTDSTTMGLALVYSGLKIRPDQEVLEAHWNHYASSGSIRHAAKRGGFQTRRVELWSDYQTMAPAQVVERLQRAIRPNTRVVAATWVHSIFGVTLPIGAMGDVVALANRGRAEDDRILFVVDGVHGFGVEDVTVGDFRCDFFAAGCHKWLFGPRGTGILWGADDAWSHLHPIIPSFSFGNDAPGRRFTPGGFHSFEHRWALDSAFEYHLRLGKKRIRDRIHALSDQLVEGLAAMKHVRIRTPRDARFRGGIVTFAVDGLSSDAVVAALRERDIIASHTPESQHVPRLSPGIMNTPGEVDRVLEAVAGLGG